jgi:hypothetical protein
VVVSVDGRTGLLKVFAEILSKSLQSSEAKQVLSVILQTRALDTLESIYLKENSRENVQD